MVCLISGNDRDIIVSQVGGFPIYPWIGDCFQNPNAFAGMYILNLVKRNIRDDVAKRKIRNFATLQQDTRYFYTFDSELHLSIDNCFGFSRESGQNNSQV